MPYFQFPSVSQQTMWGTIAGNILLQSDLIDMLQNSLLSELVLLVDFSKYGEISAGEYFFPHRIYLPNRQKSELIGYEVALSAGLATVTVYKNSLPFGQLSLIEANTEYNSVSLATPIELAQSDILSISVTQSENAQNLLLRLIIRVVKGNEN